MQASQLLIGSGWQRVPVAQELVPAIEKVFNPAGLALKQPAWPAFA